MIHKAGDKGWMHNGLTVEMSELMLQPLDKWNGRRRVYRLTKPFFISIRSTEWSYLAHMTQTIKVPMHFETDLATLPIFCQIVLGNRDDYMEAAVAHDWLCVNHIPQFIANAWMRSIMLCLGAPKWKRLAFFYGLQVFGYGSRLSNWWSTK